MFGRALVCAIPLISSQPAAFLLAALTWARSSLVVATPVQGGVIFTVNATADPGAAP
jgi:hypothetical protein